MKCVFTKITIFLLTLLLCLSTVACGEPDEPPVGSGGGNNPPVETPPTTVHEVEHSVSEGTMFTGENSTVNVLHYTTGEHESYNPWDEIAPSGGMEVAPGDTVGDMIFARNAWIEENFGIQITNTYETHDGSVFQQQVERLYQSGDAMYQMIAYFQHGAAGLMGREYFLNLSDIEYIDFEDPWWVDSAIEELSLGDYVEFGVSDMLLLDKGATGLMYFNKEMAQDLLIDDLYELVRDKEWTIYELGAYAEQAMDNADGDDAWTAKDTYGMANGDDPVLFLYCSGGHKFIEKNEEGDYYYSYCKDEGTAEAMITILEEVMYADWYWNTWAHRDEENPSFQEGQALFSSGKAKDSLELRDMENDYGILPVPMLYEGQEQYYSQVSGYHDSMFAIPLANFGNTAVIGAMIELASYYSHYNIQEPFYETILQLRGTRDEESMEMLDIVFSSRTYDLGHLYDPVGVVDKVLRYNSVTNPGEIGVLSFWDTFEGQLDEAIKDLNELKDRYNEK